MKLKLLTITVTIASVAAGLWLLAAPEELPAGRICTVFPNVGFKWDVETYLVVFPVQDTIKAGPSPFDTDKSVWARIREKFFGPQIYGQVVEVSVYGGAGARAIEDAVPADGVDRVALVPWRIGIAGEECGRPLRWKKSYRWLSEPTVFVTGQLRPQRRLGRQILTLDVLALNVYPGGWFETDLAELEVLLPDDDRADSLALANADTTSLTAGEFFSIYDVLPTRTEAENDPDSAEPNRRW